ncbi:MAG: efflux RND transporter periplasmic adaptor subunit [Planctomycetes bacterium]|nr:efflux RND transporter periplasmic adaptor subunit [Planctomycetota bacterium]
MSDLDLSGLRRGAVSITVPKKPLGPRLAVLAVGLLVLGLVASFAWDWVFPPRLVASARPRLEQAEGARSARVVAEAAGWVEPEPFATIVRPLVSGRVEELLVLEGHEVVRGETVIARLQSAALSAAAERARSERALRAARVAEAEAQLELARAALLQRGVLRAGLIDARRANATVLERVEGANAALSAAVADVAARRADLDGQQKLAEAGASFPVALAKARAEFAAAEARREGAGRAVAELKQEAQENGAALVLAAELLEQPRELLAAEKLAEASLLLARAEAARAETELQVAERELAWCEVLAPATGVVMKLLAAPGALTGPDGEGLVALYDRARLQVRVDVPLAMVAAVSEGQGVEVRSEVTGARLTKGRVLRVQRESDLLKNTLQVKVALLDPDPMLRPETLCRARFVAPDAEPGSAAGEARWWVPSTAIQSGAVQVFDPGTARARRVPVELVETRGPESLVRGDLSSTQQVLTEAVAEGTRIRVEEVR